MLYKDYNGAFNIDLKNVYPAKMMILLFIQRYNTLSLIVYEKRGLMITQYLKAGLFCNDLFHLC